MTLTHEDLQTTHDFCSWDCAAEYAKRRALDEDQAQREPRSDGLGQGR